MTQAPGWAQITSRKIQIKNDCRTAGIVSPSVVVLSDTNLLGAKEFRTVLSTETSTSRKP